MKKLKVSRAAHNSRATCERARRVRRRNGGCPTLAASRRYIRSPLKVNRRFSIAGAIDRGSPSVALDAGEAVLRRVAPEVASTRSASSAKQLRTHRSERDKSQGGKIPLVCAQVYTKRVKTKRTRRATRPQITEETVAATRRFDVGPMGRDAQRRTRAPSAPSCRPRDAPSFSDRQSVCSCSGKERRYKPRAAVAAPPGTRSAARASRARHCNRSHRAQSRQRGKDW